MRTPKLIAFTGRIGSGKTYAAEWLATQYSWERLSFAAPLKCVASDLFGLPLGMLAGATDESRAWREKEHDRLTRLFGRPMTPRRLLQEMGTDVFRKWCPDVWVDCARREVQDWHDRLWDVCFDDCRFDNEAALVRSLGGTVVHISTSKDDERVDGHASEGGVTKMPGDYVLHNCRSSLFWQGIEAVAVTGKGVDEPGLYLWEVK